MLRKTCAVLDLDDMILLTSRLLPEQNRSTKMNEVEEDCDTEDYQSEETPSTTACSSSVVIRRAHSLVPFSRLRPVRAQL